MIKVRKRGGESFEGWKFTGPASAHGHRELWDHSRRAAGRIDSVLRRF